MVKISERIKGLIRSSIGPHLTRQFASCCSLHDTKMFSKFFNISIENNKVEIPVFLRGYFKKSYTEKRCSTFIMPFNESDFNRRGRIHYKNAEITLEKLLMYSYCYSHLEVAECDNKYYYGCKGFIIDEQGNILFMPVYTAEIVEERIIYTGIKIYIHPKTSAEDASKLESVIFNKILPGFISVGIRLENIIPYTINSRETSFTEEEINNTYIPIISIEDATNKFIMSSKFPNRINEDYNSILKYNIDAISQLLCP